MLCFGLWHRIVPQVVTTYQTHHNAVSSCRIFTQLINRSIKKYEVVHDFIC